MPSIFCPYLGREIDEADCSLEHIVPESLGGTRELSISVDRKSNSDLGTSVDGPVSQLFAFRRVQYKLKGHSGTDPHWGLDFSIPDLGGREGRWEMTPAGSSLHLKPKVTFDPPQDGTLRVSVDGDPQDAHRIFDDIRRAHEAKGRTVLQEESVEQSVEQPRITGEIRVNLLALGRFYAKVALGIGHFLWGREWSSGSEAGLLRRALLSQSVEEVNAVGLQSWTITSKELGIDLQDYEHAFVLTSHPALGAALGLFLFGQPGWTFRVGEPGSSASKSEPKALILDVTTGTILRASLLELCREGRLRV